MTATLASSPFLTIAIAFLGGILPALFWLWFWWREDSHTEPKKVILLVFLGGMLTTIPVFFLERATHQVLPFGFLLILAWAGIEEGMKYLSAAILAFHGKDFDEPIDPMMYMITSALGFAALENSLFLFSSMGNDLVHISIISAAMRFVGATLLHVLASAVFGGFIALAFCKSRWTRLWYTILGGGVATLLHTMFNYFIIQEESAVLLVFSALWIGILLLLLFFERIKIIVCNINLYQK